MNNHSPNGIFIVEFGEKFTPGGGNTLCEATFPFVLF